MIYRILGTVLKNHTECQHLTTRLLGKRNNKIIGFRGFKQRGHYIMLPTELLDPESLHSEELAIKTRWF